MLEIPMPRPVRGVMGDADQSPRQSRGPRRAGELVRGAKGGPGNRRGESIGATGQWGTELASPGGSCGRPKRVDRPVSSVHRPKKGCGDSRKWFPCLTPGSYSRTGRSRPAGRTSRP
jgi:hypothetical protein